MGRLWKKSKKSQFGFNCQRAGGFAKLQIGHKMSYGLLYFMSLNSKDCSHNTKRETKT